MALTKVRNVLDVTADTMVDLLTMQHKKGSVQLLGYHERGDGGGGVFFWDAAQDKAEHNGGTIIDPDVVFPTDWNNQGQLATWFTAGTGTGCWVRKYDGAVNVKFFGAKGNYDFNDTLVIDKFFLFCGNNNLPAYINRGVYRYTGTLNLPEGIKIKGEGNPYINAFPQYGGDKDLLKQGEKHNISGSVFIFDGTGQVDTYTTNRSDVFSSVKPMVTNLSLVGISVKDVGFLQDMEVRDGSNNLTTALNDNRATAYTAGFIDTSMDSVKKDMTLFGYFDAASYIIHNQDGGDIDPDYQTFIGCLITGGVAIIGHDTPAGTASEGLTGSKWIGCNIAGADHHNRADGVYTVPAIYIDGFLGTTGIRGHNFTSTNIRTYANESIKLDHCNDIHFSNCIWEFPLLSGVTNADETGGFYGTTNTNDIVAVGCAGTSDPKFLQFLKTISGEYQIIGAGAYGHALFGQGNQGVRIAGTGNDGYIQITDDIASTVTGWKLEKDGDTDDVFNFKYENVTRLSIDKDGGLSLMGLSYGGTKTVTSGSISIGQNSYYGVLGEGSVADDLTTITGGGFDGQLLTLRTVLSASPVTLKDGGGNLRLNGDRVLSNGQDRITLMFDGLNWVEYSFSDNTL